MSAKEANIANYREVLNGMMRSGKPSATFFGFLCLAAALLDAYLNTTKSSSLSGFIANLLYTGEKLPYRFSFVSSLFLQFTLTGTAIWLLNQSAWKNFYRYELFSPAHYTNRLFTLRPTREGIDIPEKNEGSVGLLWIFSGLIFCFAVSWFLQAQILQSVNLTKLTDKLTSSAIVSALSIATGWVLFSISRACTKDVVAIWGAAAGVLITLIGAAYAPDYHAIFLSVGGLPHDRIPDIHYWETGYIAIMIMLGISVMIEGRLYVISNTIRLHIGDDRAEPLFKSSPKDTAVLVPVYLRIVSENNAKIIVLARHNREQMYHIVNMEDDRTTLTVHDHDIRAWNITSLERRICGAFKPIADNSGYFLISGSIHTISTTEIYKSKKDRTISVSALNIMEQYLFTNENVKQMLLSAVVHSLNKHTAPLSQNIIDIKKRLGHLINLVEIGHVKKDEQDKIAHISQPGVFRGRTHQETHSHYETRIEATTHFQDEISEIEKEFDAIVKQIGLWSSQFDKWWADEILEEMKINQIGDHGLLSEATEIVSSLGLRLNGVSVTMSDTASSIKQMIQSTADKINSQLSEAKEKRMANIEKKDDSTEAILHTAVQALVQHPTTSVEQVSKILHSILSGNAEHLEPPQETLGIEVKQETKEQPT